MRSQLRSQLRKHGRIQQSSFLRGHSRAREVRPPTVSTAPVPEPAERPPTISMEAYPDSFADSKKRGCTPHGPEALLPVFRAAATNFTRSLNKDFKTYIWCADYMQIRFSYMQYT